MLRVGMRLGSEIGGAISVPFIGEWWQKVPFGGYRIGTERSATFDIFERRCVKKGDFSLGKSDVQAHTPSANFAGLAGAFAP